VTPLIGRRHLSQRISLIAEEEVMSHRRIIASVAAALLVCAAATVAAGSVVPFSSSVQTTKVYKGGDGVTLPVVVKEGKPEYTREAMNQGIQGSVFMAVVVLDSGDVGEVRVTQSLDDEYGLDAQAVAAMKQWKFKPGMKDGKPVAVEVTVQMTFTLK
jgi:TonB family protein